MISTPGILNTLFFLGFIGAAITLIYFVFRRLQRDHTTGEYHFTWAVGIVILFLMGFAPGFVGLGLYLTVEKGYPLYWLALCLLLVLVFGVIGLSAVTQVSTTAVESPV